MKLTQSICLQFHRPKLSRESCFTNLFNYGGLCKERSTKQATDIFQRRALPRKIMETLKRSIFSFPIANLVSKGILYFVITKDAQLEGGKGEVSSSLSLKLEESALILGKSVLILIIYRSNFSFKMQFLSFSWRKNPKFSPKLCFWWLSKCPNSKKTSLPRQIPGYAPVL